MKLSNYEKVKPIIERIEKLESLKHHIITIDGKSNNGSIPISEGMISITTFTATGHETAFAMFKSYTQDDFAKIIQKEINELNEMLIGYGVQL